MVNNCQSLDLPLENSGYSKLTSYTDIINYLSEIIKHINGINIDYIGSSTEGRKIPVLKISSDNFKRNTKTTVLIFGQQHGNEQSGKEGILFLLNDFINENLTYLLKRINLILVPQVNPDGSEKDQRKNTNGVDLNRNHLILTETETIALHNLFYEYMPEVTLDVHENNPFGNSWIKYGYIKKIDEQFGCLTNTNVSHDIITFSKKMFLPFIENYLAQKGYSHHEYIVGGPPGVNKLRYSTVGIYDGRQSFGILNTLSFIVEGRNGRNSYDNIKHRTLGQYNALKGFLQFVYNNANEIKQMVKKAREKLICPSQNDSVIIRMKYVKDNSILKWKLLSTFSNNDTIINVEDFYPIIQSIQKIKKPYAYLIPKSDKKLISFLTKNHVNFFDYLHADNHLVKKYRIFNMKKNETKNAEEYDYEIKPELANNVDYSKYYYVPLNQISSNMLVLAFEPESDMGLLHLSQFKYLVNDKKEFSILYILKK